MAKRGRPRLNPKEKLGAHVGIRINEMLLRKLDGAARTNRRTRSQEIVARLSESLDRKRSRYEELGGDTTYNLFRLLAVAFDHVRLLTGRAWHENAYSFRQAADATETIMEALRPKGASNRFPTDHPGLQGLGKKQAAKFIADKKAADGEFVGLVAVWALEVSSDDDDDFGRKLFEIRRSLIGKLRRSGRLGWARRNLRMHPTLKQHREPEKERSK